MIGCGIKAENRDRAYSEIIAQLEEMKNGNFTEDDISNAKRTLISGLRQLNDSPSAMEAFGFRRFLACVNEDIDECVEKVNAVSHDDILRVAQGVRPDTVYFLCGQAKGEDDDNE
jgi:predicted Zn-dependent peptidase